jgi:Ser/Thr protein kinase RdoA (MazF antagonist)
MSSSGFPVDASIVSSQALATEVLSNYPLPHPLSCKFLQQSLNDTYTVQAGASKYYLRVYRHGWRDKPQIEAEVDLLNHLVAERQPVSSPVAKDDGTYLTQIDAPEGTRYAVLFTEAPGRRPAFNTTDCRQFGEIVANLHASMDQQPEDARRFHLDLAHLIDEPLEYIEPYLSHRPREFENLQRTAESLKSDIEGLLTTNMPAYGGCHGDHHGGNVNQDREGRMVVFDFDCYGYGWRAYDLAVFLWQASGPPGLNGKGNADAPSQWKSFLEGYSQVRTLTNDELEATRLFVPIRRIWWMGVQTRLAQTVGRNPWPNLAGLDEDAQRVWFDRNIGLVDDSIDRQLP